MKKQKYFSAKRITGLAILLALVIVLQVFGSYFKIGATSLSFVLVPIVLAGILYGAIAGGMLKGIRLGILDESFKECAERAVAGICNQVAEDGTVLGVSAGTTVGYDADHYRNIIVRPMAYGQSLALIALVEALGEG